MNKSVMVIAACCALICASTAAHATKIEYTQSGNTLNFTVFNDTASTIKAFDIAFGETTDGLSFANVGAFSDVSAGTAPAGWGSYSLPSSTEDAWPLPWLYGAEAASGGLGNGSLSGFSTTYLLSSTASLDRLWFNLYDANNGVIESGFATRYDDGNAAPVPEPGTCALLGAGLAGLAFWRRKAAKAS